MSDDYAMRDGEGFSEYLDRAWLKLPPEHKVTADFIQWLKLNADAQEPIDLYSLAMQSFKALMNLENRIVLLEEQNKK